MKKAKKMRQTTTRKPPRSCARYCTYSLRPSMHIHTPFRFPLSNPTSLSNKEEQKKTANKSTWTDEKKRTRKKMKESCYKNKRRREKKKKSKTNKNKNGKSTHKKER
eukprot:TRINITY_DN1531_c2_g1_i1.p1 TRINITY_DN1531_c2_g1~~TRINITY_DN1531_c2_g1_i1.p1  ORF type:complete len:107 (+),score=7.58 TRINITY_DN1531_c2_g1_i1:468-788(+)